MHALESEAAELVPAGLIRARVTRRHPYLYSDEQIQALLAAASALSPPALAATMSTLIGLLAVSGMRVGEAIALDAGDLDTDRQLLRVPGKYGKGRLVPLHPSAVKALTGYLAGHPADGPLLVGVRGNRLTPTPPAQPSARSCSSVGSRRGRDAVPRAYTISGTPSPCTARRSAAARTWTRASRYSPTTSATSTRPAPTGI